ncbi:hypothetical protein P5673_031252 [Acropora cervicornis]|uniref:Uncharacterized protein n=1 Tax=Acropora cervicornis TaxID=6130 RepID=A0AAD9PSZ6_ACRCE|nr:hypothetical protein P5673_031252 [Acropora cervicornis]
MTVNVHQLCHLVYFVHLFGPLWVNSCFGFEKMNGCLTSMIHGTQHIAEEVAFTLSVVRNLPSLLPKLNPSINSTSVLQFAKCLVGEKSSTPLSIKCQTGFFLLGKPKKESLKEDYREALNTFFACRGLPLLSDTAKVDIYLRRKMKNQTVTSTLYDRAKKPAVTRLSTVTVVERHNLEMYAVMSTVKISLWQL